MPRPISLSLSTRALAHNLAQVQRHLAGVARSQADAARTAPGVWAVIKANAYGHGIEMAVSAFSRAQGLALLDFDEAVRAREAGWDGPILMLEGFFEPGDIEWLDRYHLACAIHDPTQLDMLAHAQVGRPIDVFVKLNSGMNRLGFLPDKYADAFAGAQVLQRKGVLGQVGKMTHFATADGPEGVAGQMAVFEATVQGLPGPVSVCNSAATLRYADIALAAPDQPSWVRPGICLYGASPFDDVSADDLGLMPAMTLQSRLIGIQQLKAGDRVGYGGRFAAQHPIRVGVVACGYADGYPRHAQDGTPVTVAGRHTTLVGRVSMDMLLVDLTHLPDATVGAPVILFGQGGPGVDEVARHSHTIGYELLCAMAPRVPRHTAD